MYIFIILGNFITILWNSSNGLQIPKNSSNVTAQDIMYMGTPTTGEHRTVLEESDWVNVDLPSDMLLGMYVCGYAYYYICYVCIFI